MAMEEMFCMICYYKAYTGKKKKKDRQTEMKELCLLDLFLSAPLCVCVCVCDAITVGNCSGKK